jgi:hypothetical protein
MGGNDVTRRSQNPFPTLFRTVIVDEGRRSAMRIYHHRLISSVTRSPLDKLALVALCSVLTLSPSLLTSPHERLPSPRTPTIPYSHLPHYSQIVQHINIWPTCSIAAAVGKKAHIVPHRRAVQQGKPWCLQPTAACGQDVPRPRGDRLDRQACQMGVGGPLVSRATPNVEASAGPEPTADR